MRWVAPQPGPMPVFSPAAFAGSRDTLYLLSESGPAASPLVAALTDAIMRAGRRQAEMAGGRLDPPMVPILDEAANICRIADLPDAGERQTFSVHEVAHNHVEGEGCLRRGLVYPDRGGPDSWRDRCGAAMTRWDASAASSAITMNAAIRRRARDVPPAPGYIGLNR